MILCHSDVHTNCDNPLQKGTRITSGSAARSSHKGGDCIHECTKQNIAVFEPSPRRFSKKDMRPFQQNSSCWVIKLNMYKSYMSLKFPSGQYMSACACATVLSSGNRLSWADRWLSCRHLGLPSISAQLTLVSSLQPWDMPRRRAIGALSVFSEIIMSLQACTIENSTWKHASRRCTLNENICS